MVKSTGALGGVKWTGTASVVTAVTQLLQVAILARFLNPEDFGLMAIALLVVGISQIFLDAGVSNAIIYMQETDNKKLSTLYWLNLSAGVIVFVVIFFSAPLVALLYDEKALSPVIRWLSLVFLIQPLGQQYYILMQKNLDFKGIAKRDIVSKTFGLIGGVLTAFLGWGVYALVAGHVLMVCSSTIMLISIGRKIHVPHFYFNIKEVRSYISFGLYQLGERGINYLNLQMDTLLIGKMLGVEVLGVYTVAKDLVLKPTQLINPIITKVAFPIMARIKDNSEELQRVYYKTVRGLITINAPLFLFMAFFADEVIMLVFGEGWSAAVPVLSILSFYMLLRSIGNPVGALMLAKGRADMGFYWNLGLAVVIPITVFLGVEYDLEGVSYALVGMQALLFYPGWRLLVHKLCGLSFSRYLKAISIPLANSLIIAAFVYGISVFVDISPLLTIVLASVLFGLLYLIISYFNNHLVREYNLSALLGRNTKNI